MKLSKPMKPLMYIYIKDYSDGTKTRLVQEYGYTTRTDMTKKKWRDNITATVRKPKKGDKANAGSSKVLNYTDGVIHGFTLNELNMADGVIYGWWTGGIVFNAVKQKGKLIIMPTHEGVR